ncbi:hypothetical protein ACERK3_11640 [Phycisphaerales bacterium AB-hyl4]|uniref:Uncharacterized protein n=1 Tax=Natronomicrosphaera hydrolytica TaxID=3242702 RepID=A0ABV4U5R4_9BACT
MISDGDSKQPGVESGKAAASVGGMRLCRSYRVVAIVALLFFSTLLLVRGPLMNPVPVGDFVHFYTAARAWVQGANPYDYAALKRVVDEAPQAPRRTWLRSHLIALYPPATFPLMSPISASTAMKH